MEEELRRINSINKNAQKVPVKTLKELEEYKLDAEGFRKLLEVKTAELKKIKVHILDNV